MKLMKVLEPITAENLSELRPGEWIWDNKKVRKHPGERIYEPIGFRKIGTLNVDFYFTGSNPSPFSLSSIQKGRDIWVKFEEGRFFRFKWSMLENIEDLSNKRETE